VALVDLRIPLAEFWGLTPLELDAFHRRYAQAREEDQLLFGILASSIVNFSFYAPKKPVKPSDFGLGPRPQKARSQSSALSEQDIAEQWRLFFRRMGAKPAPQPQPQLSGEN
jgi:hypothetical protein